MNSAHKIQIYCFFFAFSVIVDPARGPRKKQMPYAIQTNTKE